MDDLKFFNKHREKIFRNFIQCQDPTYLQRMLQLQKRLDLNFSKETALEYLQGVLLASKQKIRDMNEAKVFIIKEEIQDLLIKTKNTNFERNLPFNTLWIEGEIPLDENGVIQGCLIVKDRYGTTASFWIDPTNSPKNLSEEITKTVGVGGGMGIAINLFEDEEDEMMDYVERVSPIQKKFQGGLKPKFKKELRNYIFNFLDFLNHPDVETRRVKWFNNENRIKKGKLPVPDRVLINIKGKLRRYIYEELPLKTAHHKSPSYSFWVRGHYMHFWDRDKWNKLYAMDEADLKEKGYQIGEEGAISKWVFPYVKGNGILREKPYSLKEELNIIGEGSGNV